MTPAELKRLSTIDAVYGIAAVILLTAGLTLWLGGIGKPTEFYSRNWVFQLKIALFVVVGILSIFPTVFFIKGRKKKENIVQVPKSIFWIIRTELLILFLIPLLAGLMSRGIGLSIDK